MKHDKQLLNKIIGELFSLSEIGRVYINTANEYSSQDIQPLAELNLYKYKDMINKIQQKISEFEEEDRLKRERLEAE